MTEPINFASTTPRFDLPLLFQGQAQKEFFVNECLMLVDVLLHSAVKGVTSDPPPAPAPGDGWLVGADPSGAWAGKANCLAGFTGSTWVFAGPREGMRVFDLALDQYRTFAGSWTAPMAPTAPQGGTTIDAEARNALNQLITALRAAGIFAPA